MPPRIPSVLSAHPSTTCLNTACRSSQTVRCLSSTAPVQASAGKYTRPTKMRRYMYGWLASQGAAFRDPLPGSTNYLGAYDRTGRLLRQPVRRPTGESEESAEKQSNAEAGELQRDRDGNVVGDRILPPETLSDLRPFPLNRDFRSQPVASENLREAVWGKIMKDGLSVPHVSAELGISMERVAAIVRLKEVEKEWIRKKIPLAKPYQNAVLSMLPQTRYPAKEGTNEVHESINDLPVHAATTLQIWHPTSESRHFTRADAAEVFQRGLLPADDRVPHPELHVLEKDRLSGMSLEDRTEAARQRTEVEEKAKADREAKKSQREAANLIVVPQNRWDFRFTRISVEQVGKDGRGHKGVGARYGIPHEDRKRGQVKIPTFVR